MKPFNVKEVATRLGISPLRVRQLINSGELAAFSPGGHRLFVTPEDLAAFIALKRVKPTTGAAGEVAR